MKPVFRLSAIVTFLLPLSCGASLVEITTRVFTPPPSLEMPGQMRILSKGEWQQTLRTLAMTKGTIFRMATATPTPSGKTTRVEIPNPKPRGIWQRDAEPGFPARSIEYTPKATRGGIEVTGDFQLKPGAVRGKAGPETVTAVKIHEVIPEDKVLTFGVGGHFFVVEASRVDE